MESGKTKKEAAPKKVTNARVILIVVLHLWEDDLASSMIDGSLSGWGRANCSCPQSHPNVTKLCIALQFLTQLTVFRNSEPDKLKYSPYSAVQAAKIHQNISAS